MQEKKRLTAAEFEPLRPFLQTLSADRVEAARLSLVEGLTLQAVGDRYSWSRQAVAGVVRAVLKVSDNWRESQRIADTSIGAVPPGWERATLIAPVELMASFRRDTPPLPVPTLKPEKKKAQR